MGLLTGLFFRGGDRGKKDSCICFECSIVGRAVKKLKIYIFFEKQNLIIRSRILWVSHFCSAGDFPSP